MRRANQKLIEIPETLKMVRVPAATSNNPFPSCPKPLFQRKGKGKAIGKKMIFFYSHGNETHFHKKSFFTDWFWNAEIAYSTANAKRRFEPRVQVFSDISVVFFSTRRIVLSMPGSSLRINWLCFYLLISLFEKCLTLI